MGAKIGAWENFEWHLRICVYKIVLYYHGNSLVLKSGGNNLGHIQGVDK